MRYHLSGTLMQTVEMALDAGECVYSQTACMCWMDPQVSMQTNTGGGFLSGLKRALSGGTLFVTDFIAQAPGHVAFAPRFPGTIMPVQLGPGQSLICRRRASSAPRNP